MPSTSWGMQYVVGQIQISGHTCKDCVKFYMRIYLEFCMDWGITNYFFSRDKYRAALSVLSVFLQPLRDSMKWCSQESKCSEIQHCVICVRQKTTIISTGWALIRWHQSESREATEKPDTINVINMEGPDAQQTDVEWNLDLRATLSVATVNHTGDETVDLTLTLPLPQLKILHAQ